MNKFGYLATFGMECVPQYESPQIPDRDAYSDIQNTENNT